ncbi:MAG: hypothetical protein ACJ8MH_03345, partial [Povalibacter sp.]
MRIEPDNPLLWIELGKVRQAEGNYVQAENMARKALTMSANAPRAQSSAWSLISESLRGRGKNTEAREAQMRAEQIRYEQELSSRKKTQKAHRKRTKLLRSAMCSMCFFAAQSLLHLCDLFRDSFLRNPNVL